MEASKAKMKALKWADLLESQMVWKTASMKLLVSLLGLLKALKEMSLLSSFRKDVFSYE
jgi:hypothetical protein